MPLPGALLDSDDDDVPSNVAAPVTPQIAASNSGRAGQGYTDESTSQQYIGQGRPSSLIQSSDGSAVADDATRNVRARTEVSGAATSVPGMAAVSTPSALSRTPSTGWGVGLVAVTPIAAAAPPAANLAAPSMPKVHSVVSPQSSPKALQGPSHIKAEPLSRNGSSEGSDSDGGEGLSKGILADRIESVQREIDLINAEIQRLQQDIERNPSPPALPVCTSPIKHSASGPATSTVSDNTLVLPSSSPTPSPSPPRHFSTRAVIDSELVRKIYAENQAHRTRAYCDIDAMLGLPNRAVLTSDTHAFDPYSLGMAGDETVMYAHVQDSPFFAANIRRFAQVKHLIVEKVREAHQKRQKLIHKAVRMERRLREAAVTAGLYEAPAVECDAATRTPRLRREVTAISADTLTPKAGGAAVGIERSERRVSRNSCAVIPPMLTEQEKRAVAMDNRNTIDPDPMLSLQIRKLSNVWSDEEHAAFFERFAAHDKQFHKIAEFLVNKTCNDVVEFYYKNKNRTAFKHRLKLINRLKERSLPFLRYGSHDAMLSNLRDGAITTYVATRPGSDAFIWLRQRQAEEQEVARAEAELGCLVRELAVRKEEKMKASNPPVAAPKSEKAKNSGKGSKEKKDAGLLTDKEARANISVKEKVKSGTKESMSIKAEQSLGDPIRDTSSEINANHPAEELVGSTDAHAAVVGVSSAGTELQAFDSALSKKVSKSRAIGWSVDEENVFVAHVQAHGKDWKKISSLMPGKSQVALRQQFKKMSEQGQLPENLLKTERSSVVGGSTSLSNAAKNVKAQARRMQQLTVSATATELVEAGTEHFALRDLSQVDSQQLGHLFMMHMMQQLQNSQGSDADRAQLAQIVNTLQEHRSQTFLQLIHEAAQLLVNQQAEAAAAAAANMEVGTLDDDAADEDEEGEGEDVCDDDHDMKEGPATEGQNGDTQTNSVSDVDFVDGCDKVEMSVAADCVVDMREDDAVCTVDRHDEDGMNEALDGELESENKREVTHSYADAGAEVVAGSNDVEAPGGADGLAEMREEQIAPIGSSVDEIPAEGDLTLEKKDHSDDFPETCSNTHVAPVSEEK